MINYTPTPDYYNDYIAHFGILGMKWGKKNGPPYPLGSNVSTGRRLKNVGSVKKKKMDRHERAANASARDAADLRKHGYTKEADAVQKVSDQQRAKSKTAGVKTINQGPKYATPKSVSMPNPELAKRAKEIGDKEVYEVAKGKPIKNIKSPETGFAQKEIDRKANVEKISRYLDNGKNQRKHEKELTRISKDIYASSPKIQKATKEYVNGINNKADDKTLDALALNLFIVCESESIKYLGNEGNKRIKGSLVIDKEQSYKTNNIVTKPLTKGIALSDYVIQEVNNQIEKQKKG